MQTRNLVIESQCDKTRYKLVLEPDSVILSVTYRHLNGRYGEMIPQKVEQATIGYYRAWKTDGEPETENESYWFVRALYEHHQGRRAFWYYFQPTQTLVVCPPPPDSGSLISVHYEPPLEHILSSEIVSTPENDLKPIPVYGKEPVKLPVAC